MRIETIPEWALTAPDEKAIVALLHSAFGPAFGAQSYHHQRHHLRFVARDPGIVGHIAITERAVRLGPYLQDVAGLAEVATAPDRRGQGIAGALLQAVIGWAQATRLDHLILFGDAALYAAAGFRPVTNLMTYVDMDGKITNAVKTEPADGLMALPLRNSPWDDTAPLDMLGHLF
jgi:predicted N-acetyltransferase YhbS